MEPRRLASVAARRPADPGRAGAGLPGRAHRRSGQRRPRAGDAAGAAQRVLRRSVSGPRRPAGARRSTCARGWRAATSSCSASTRASTASWRRSSGALAIQDLVSASGYRLDGPVRPRPGRRPPSPSTSSPPWAATTSSPCWPAPASRASACSPATQEMADLQRAAPGFRDQVLGIVGVKIAHRQDVPESAEMIAKMAGTQWVWEETRHVRGLLSRRQRPAGEPAPGGALPRAPQRDQDAAGRARGGAHQAADVRGAAGAGGAGAVRRRGARA